MWKIDQGTMTGNTAAAFAGALDWKTFELGSKTILLKNTGEATLGYRLFGYVAEEGQPVELVAERALDAGETAEFHYERQWHRLLLQVKNGSGPTSYQVDYEGQGA